MKAAQWELQNPVIRDKQTAIESDTYRMKIGNGSTPYNDLPYHGTVEVHNSICFDFDYGSFSDPNLNTPIDPGTLNDPAINFFLDLCEF